MLREGKQMKDIDIKNNIIRLKAKETARKLRHNQTSAEKYLWEYLRNRSFKNIKFLRQHQIICEYLNERSYFIADFYCAKYKVIIEIDGEVHLKQKEKDKTRENLLKTSGYRIIRFKNLSLS